MDITDWIIDIALIAIVFRQIREARLDLVAVLLPLGLCVFVGQKYLDGVPSGGNNLLLIAGFTAVGIACGVLSGLTTRVRADGGRYALVKAGWVAAGTWVASMGFRLGFVVWATHGGAATLGRWSMEHGIDTDRAWTAALVLMALGEVFVRTGLLVVRGRRAVAAHRTAPTRTLAAA
ncbi:hypothetical protein [Jatrophihabitans fulvus]